MLGRLAVMLGRLAVMQGRPAVTHCGRTDSAGSHLTVTTSARTAAGRC